MWIREHLLSCCHVCHHKNVIDEYLFQMEYLLEAALVQYKNQTNAQNTDISNTAEHR
jgi:hypothetical protein